MAEKRAHTGRRRSGVSSSLPTGRAKTKEEIMTEMRNAMWESDMKRALWLSHYMHIAFADVNDYTEADARAYVDRLKAVVGSDRLPEPDGGVSGEGAPAGPEEGSEAASADGTGAGGPVDGDAKDALGEAIRAVLPGAPGPDADREECDEFVESIAVDRMRGMTGDANIGRLARAVFADIPDGDDGDACKEYLDGLSRKLERYGRMFGKIMDMEPEEAKTDPELAKRFEDAWASYLYGGMEEIEETFRGAMKSE